MEENEGQNAMANEIESLKSMFGELVSVPVIIAVLESCEGDVNLAAEGLMDIINNSPTTPEEENATGGYNFGETEPDIPTNIPKPPDASKIAKIQELNPCPLHREDERTMNVHSNFDNEYPSSSQDVRVSLPPPPPPRPISYAAISQNTGAVPKVRENSYANSTAEPHATKNTYQNHHVHNITRDMSYVKFQDNCWSSQFKNILTTHNQGSRLMIIMRGVPGSGKSNLARHIIEMTVGGSHQNFATHIFCSDDYFVSRGKYIYDRNNLDVAHSTNQRKVTDATNQGVSPIIVDNTHVHMWEMGPYVEDAVNNGYYLEIVEPKTPWAKSLNELSKRNTHNVPKEKIKRMLDNYEENITVEKIFRYFKVTYPKSKKPPVLRSIPPLPEQIPYFDFSETPPNPPNSPKPPDTPEGNSQNTTQKTSAMIHTSTTENTKNTKSNSQKCSNSRGTDTEKSPNDGIHLRNTDTMDLLDCVDVEESERLGKILDAQKKQDEATNIELEWENGETWETELKSTDNNETTNIPKPPRSLRQENDSDQLIEPSLICDDWSQISLFLPRWQNDTKSISDYTRNAAKTTSTGTSIEIGDVDNTVGLHKIIDCNPRDINDLISNEDIIERIPLQRMLDKSTSTHEHFLAETQRCKNEEQHFIAFRKMFKTVARPILRDVFDKCRGDVNWAVNLVLDSIGDNEIKVHKSEELSDTEEETVDGCECLAAYNIIPASSSPQPLNVSTEIAHQDSEQLTPNHQKRPKKEKKHSENEKTLELRRQIENHIMISDNHYSQHYLNLRRGRRDNLVHDMFKPSTSNINNDERVLKGSPNDVTADAIITDPVTNNADPDGAVASNFSGDQQSANLDWYTELNASETQSKVSDTFSDDGDRSLESQNISVKIGMDFVNKLDELFGRQGIIYPENIKPVVSISMSVLKEINALWAESIAFQMDNATQQTNEMLKEDEEFARELVLKEKEITQEDKEGDVPDFKELMDMDLALSIYQKEVAEWRNSEPQDMAAKMTRDKLYSLFPDVSQVTLSELLMAHENNFHSTVESLLMSTGQAHILEAKNGVNKFVMQKEIEKKKKILEEGQMAMSETEWPLLPQPGYVVTLDTVNHYREEAHRYLQARNVNVQKAQYCVGRNQYSIATFYSDLAAYNTRRYEQANSMAAASLIQYHAANTDTDIIDLHYLRVAEAREALDMFIDSKIQKLRENKARGKDFGVVNLYIITGRGLHSPGMPRIKPAVKRRLHERDMSYVIFERNPGLLGTKINEYHRMTHEIVRD